MKRGFLFGILLILIISIVIAVGEPAITWNYPSPADGSTTHNNFVYLNTTITDDTNTSSFFDWDNSLVAYLSFDAYNSSGVYDNSTNSNFANFGGGMSTSNIATGKYGKGLNFSGGNYHINISDSDLIDLSGNYSILLWVKFNHFVSGVEEELFSKEHAPIPAEQRGYYMYKNGADTDLYFITHNVSNNQEYDTITYSTPDGEWAHIAITFNGTHVKMYENGVFEKNFTTGGPLGVYTNDLIIGANSIHSANFFNGSMDEFSIHSRTLSPEEINATFNNGAWRLYKNFTGLSNGTYNYSVYSMDESGNLTIESRDVTIGNTVPNTPSVTLTSLDGLNYASSDLKCSAILTDNETDYMNVSVNWYRDGILNLSMYYNINYTNGSTFNAILNQTPKPFILDPFAEHAPNDFSIFYEDGWYHAYYIKYDQGFNSKAFGYEKSQDMTHWSFIDDVVPANTTSNWMQSQVWAPHVIKNGTNNYLMYYTGVDRTVGNPVQRLALAKSEDLANWENANVNNCPNTDYHGCIWDCNLSWSNWNASATGWVDSCRDPTVFVDDDGMAYMVYSVNVLATNKMVVGIANSTNLVDWTDMGPINKTSSANVGIDQAESPFLWKQNNTYYLYLSSDNNPYYHIKETHTTDITNLSVDAWSTPVLVSNGSYANEMLNLTNATGFNVWADIPDPGYNITFRKFEINDTDSTTTLSNHNSSIIAGITTLGDVWTCGIRIFDGYDFNSWVNSSPLTITQASTPDPSPGGRKYYFRQETSQKDGSLKLGLRLKGDDKEILEIKNSLFGLKKISITPNKYTSGYITISQKSEEELMCETNKEQKIYKVLEISHEGISNTNLDEVSLEFEIDQDWIDSNKITRIEGFKCNGEEKIMLDVSEEGDNYLFTSDGFSTWVLGGSIDTIEKPTIPEEKPKDKTIKNLFKETEDRITSTPQFPHLLVMIVLTVLIIILIITQIKKKKTFKIQNTNFNYGTKR